MRVWLLEPQQDYDISELYEKYEVRFIFDNKDAAYRFRADPNGLLKFLRVWACERFVPKTDAIVLTGNLTMVSLMVLAAQRESNTKLVFLRWDSILKQYESFDTGVLYGPYPHARARNLRAEQEGAQPIVHVDGCPEIRVDAES